MPKFGEMPAIFLEIAEEFKEFAYVHDQQIFVVGGVEHGLTTLDLLDKLEYPQGHKVGIDNLPNIPMALDVFGHPISTPRFFSWATKMDTSVVFTSTRTVMREVFGTIIGKKLSSDTEDAAAGMGFGASFIREGHINLSVLGSCACIGPRVDGHTVDYHEWETGYAEYEVHNIDAEVQFISLYAGIGHMARLCAESDTPI